MKLLRLLQIFFPITVICLMVFGKTYAASDSIWPDKVKVGGEFRERNESEINYNSQMPPTLINDTYVYLRSRVYLDLNPASFIRIFGMFQNSETINQTTALIKTPDLTKFYQGFVYVKGEGEGLTTSVKVGRQELVYGDQRLIGNNDWNNLGRSFDGGVVRIENPSYWLDLIGTRIHPSSGNEIQFGGTYGHWKNFPQGELEPYILVLHGSHAGLSSGALGLVTLGARIKAKFKKNFDYGFEGAYQTGESAGNLVSALATHLHLGYTFLPFWKPRLAIEYNFASGDNNPTTGKVTTFNNLFPTNHDKYGYMDLFAWKNLHDFRAGFYTSPTAFMQTFLDYHLFLLPDPVNGEFLANGTQFRPGAAGVSNYAGQEVDFLIKFKPLKYFDALMGYSVFFPGAFYSDTGGSHIAQFFYSQLSAHY